MSITLWKFRPITFIVFLITFPVTLSKSAAFHRLILIQLFIVKPP